MGAVNFVIALLTFYNKQCFEHDAYWVLGYVAWDCGVGLRHIGMGYMDGAWGWMYMDGT